MDANKKFDLVNLQCPNESKILANILNNHLLRFCVVASTSVPWIYMSQFWHTLKMDELKYKLKFFFDTKELTITMVPFFLNDIGFSMQLRSLSNFVSKGLPQPWQTLCKIFARCLTTRVIGHDQPSFQIMQMLYCFINNVHVDYAELLWEGLYYSLTHPTTLIPYPKFTKIIVDHYMTEHPDISRRVDDNYHKVENDGLVKNIFNTRKNKKGA
ncbi:hypothetical protein Tco_0955409 [Tanacetum coccineum]|uniref:Uncharacterized protein n=1 Tax=Tanacetum coccineum TaxID=301880 RepID=A0ABQ5E744_9ASTR